MFLFFSCRGVAVFLPRSVGVQSNKKNTEDVVEGAENMSVSLSVFIVNADGKQKGLDDKKPDSVDYN